MSVTRLQRVLRVCSFGPIPVKYAEALSLQERLAELCKQQQAPDTLLQLQVRLAIRSIPFMCRHCACCKVVDPCACLRPFAAACSKRYCIARKHWTITLSVCYSTQAFTLWESEDRLLTSKFPNQNLKNKVSTFITPGGEAKRRFTDLAR